MQNTLFGQILHSWDGAGINPNSKFRVLTIFINVIYDTNQNYYDSVKPTQFWGQASIEGVNNEAIPSYLLDFIDTTYNCGNLHGSMTRLYGESSFDSLQITGDFVVVNVKESSVLLNYNYFNYYTIGNTAIDIINQNGLQTLYHHDSIYDYDLLNNDTIFYIQFLIRNITSNYGGLSPGEGYGNQTVTKKIRIGNQLYSYRKSSMQCCGSGNIANEIGNVVYHELSHSLFGTNAFHTSGGNHYGSQEYMPFLTIQEGYGLMGQAGKSLSSCNGYERWRMHWKHPNAPDYITARNMDNTTYQISDIRKEDGNKSFLLRDFVTYGDAIRIKLPYKDSEDASNQYIWLENHKVGLNNKLDFFQYSNISDCRPQGKAGIYAYYQIGRDILSGAKYEVWFIHERDNLKIIPAEGYWNYSISIDTNNPYNMQCINWDDHTYYHYREEANPFCGYQDQEVQYHPMITDNMLALSQAYPMWRKKIGNNIIDSLAILGDNRDAFSVYSKINMGTNPSTCNAKTYYNYIYKSGTYDFTSQVNRNNQTTYLTGLSIEMIPQANNDFIVHIRWDDYDIVNDANWTGKIVLKEKANLTNGNNILLTQNLTLAEPFRNTESEVFAPTTTLTCENGSVFTLEPQSSVSLEQKSKIVLQSGSTFIISDLAEVVVGANCTFEIEPCATLIIQSSGKLIIDDSAIFTVHPDAIIQIDEINNILLPINANFSTENGLPFTSVVELLNVLGIAIDYSINHNILMCGQNVLLTKVLTIESGAELTIQNTVRCLKDVSIVIKPGGKLIVDGGTLTSNTCNGELWQGIFVEGNPSDPTQHESMQGVVELINGAVIENAVCAINVGYRLLGVNPVMCFSGGGIVKASNASFINNLQAVEFGPYERHLQVGLTENRNNVSWFKNCTFIVNNDALFDINEFKEHVKLIGVRGIAFAGCSFDGINYIGSAIYSSSSGFYLANRLIFDPMNQERNHFSNFNIAINIEDGGTKAISIYNSDFHNNNICIRAEGTSELYIRANTLNIPYSPYYGPTTGISLTNCSRFYIDNNTFHGVWQCNYGLIVHHSEANNNIVKNNTFSFLNTACLAYGKNSDGANVINGYKGLQYHCNWYEENGKDIVVEDYEGINGNIRFVQGEADKASGNIFSPNGTNLYSPNYDFQYFYKFNSLRHEPLNSSSNICLRPKYFDVCNYQIGVINPNIAPYDPPTNWNDELTTQYNQINNMLLPLKDHYISMGYNQFPIDWQMYFYGGYIPPHLEEQVNLYYAINDLENELSEVCKQAVYYVHSDELFDFEAYHSWLTRIHSPEADYLLAESYYEREQYGECFDVLNNIPTQYENFNDIEHQNYLSFYNLKEQLRGSGQTWSDISEGSVEYQQLNDIAVSGINGAAFKARAILSAYFNQDYPPVILEPPLLDLCWYIANLTGDGTSGEEGEEVGITMQKNDTSKLSLRPNPALDELTIDNGINNIQEVSIFDVLGKELKRYSVNNSKITLNISDLSSGIYILKASTQKGIHIKKFVKE